MRHIIAVLFFVVSIMASQQATAADRSCKEALDAPNADNGDEAANAGNNYGPLVTEINGASISSPDDLRAALKSTGDKTALISGGDFSGWNFAALKFSLEGACFFESKMARSNWNGGEFAGIGFIKVDLEAASLNNAKLERVLLREAGLKDVSMAGAKLRGGHFDGGWGGSVENWNLTGADMRDFKFDCGITIGDGCPLDRSGVKFVHTDLTNADIASYNYWGGADYAGAILDGTKLAPRQLPEVAGAFVKGAVTLVGGNASVMLKPTEVVELQRLYSDAGKVTDEPSFDCSKAGTPVEKMICGEYETEMRRLDRWMDELYATIRPKNPDIAPRQKKWLAKRNACKDRDCMHQAYNQRISEMLTLLGEPEPIKPGEVALYVYEADELVSSADFRQTALYDKIVPVLIGASMGEVILARNRDGSYRIDGESVGANAHLCSVGGDNLRFNPKTGWFSGRRESEPGMLAAVFRIFGDTIEFPGNGHPDEVRFPGSEGYASCGMRAILAPMMRIKADAALIAKQQAYYEAERN